jgi:dTMP kinase
VEQVCVGWRAAASSGCREHSPGVRVALQGARQPVVEHWDATARLCPTIVRHAAIVDSRIADDPARWPKDPTPNPTPIGSSPTAANLRRVRRGRLITIEGIDGAGKSTLAHALLERLRGRQEPVELLREPGGVALSEQIRSLVKDPALAIGARAEALLYAAARAQLVHERVRPLLAEGATVLLDRFVDSSLAYQGAGRALGVEQIRALNLFATEDLLPDCTLLLRISAATARARLTLRGDSPSLSESSASDRFEREADSFFEEIAAAYEALARQDPLRVHVLDAEQSAEAVLEHALSAIDAARPSAAAD